MDLNPIHHLSPGKKIKCSYFDYVQLLMLARLVNGLKPHPPPFCSQWNEMLLFGLCSLLMISQAGWWTQTPSATPLQTKKWNAHILIMFNFWWLARLVNGLEPHPPLLSSQKKWNAHFWITFNFWWSAWLIDELEPHLPSLSSQKNEMLIFVLHSTSDVGQTSQWTQTPSTTPLQPKKWNASFMDYAQLLLIGWAEWWTQTPSTTPLQPKIMKCSFLDYVHFWWSAWLIDELEPHLPPLSYQKN